MAPKPPPRTAPRRLGPAARREQLVAVGLDLLAEASLDEVTADAVAGRAGVSKGLVFHYFPTTRDLQVAVLRVKAAELVECVDAAPDAAPGDRLLAGLDAYIAFIEVQPRTYRALVRSAGSDPQLLAIFEETRAAVVDLIAAALGTDALPAGLRLSLRGWLALVEETTLHWLDEAPVPRAELVAFLHRSATALLADPVALAG